MVALDPPIRTAFDTIIVPIADTDRPEVADLLEATVGRHRFRRGVIVDAVPVTGLLARRGLELVGAITYVGHVDEAEILAVGALDEAVFGRLVEHACTALLVDHRRVFTVATNVETGLHRRLMRAGFRLCTLRAGAIRKARTMDGAVHIPQSIDGIAVTDELEFEWLKR